jgi:hypothetical protein
MGKFSNSSNQQKRFSNPINTNLLSPYSIEIANLKQTPIWEILGITQDEYLARQNALIYNAVTIEAEILTKVENNIDPVNDATIISMVEHEDVATVNELLASQTVTNVTTGLKVGDIVQQIETVIHSRNTNQ